MTSKNIFIKLSGSLAIVSLLLPAVAVAQTDRASSTRLDKMIGENFCARIAEFEGKIDQRISDREGKLAARKGEREENLKTKRADRDMRLTTKRSETLSRRDAQFVGLENKATTTAQKTAVANFKTAVTNAIVVRKAAVDAAITAFRLAVDEAVADRKTGVESIRSAFKTSTDAAIEKAKADCAAGVEGKTVRENMRVSIKESRDELVTDVQTLDKAKVDIEAAIAIRKSAIEKALTDFKAAIEKARVDLKNSI